MDLVAVILFILGGLVGLWMLRYVLYSINIPKGLSLIHGCLVIAGYIVLLTYNLTTSNDHKHWQSFSIFSAAIPLGFYVLYRDLSNKSLPRWLILTHAAIGVTGIGWILYHTLGGK